MADLIPHQRLRQAREASGLSQVELAERLGITSQALSDVERGRRVPSLDWLHRAAVELGIDPSDLDDRLAPLPDD